MFALKSTKLPEVFFECIRCFYQKGKIYSAKINEYPEKLAGYNF